MSDRWDFFVENKKTSVSLLITEQIQLLYTEEQHQVKEWMTKYNF